MTFTDERGGTQVTHHILDSSPAAEPPPPPTPRSVRRWRRWRARIIFLVIVLVLIAVGIRQTTAHLRAQKRLALGAVTLTADPVDITSPVTGTVTYVALGDERQVKSGQPLVKISGLAANGRTTTVTLRASLSGATASVGVQVGSTVQYGQLVVRLYQPQRMYFQAQYPSRDLAKIKIGMKAHLTVKSLPPVLARVERVQAQLGIDPTSQPTSTIVLTPINPARVRDLVPGLEFNGWLQVGSAPPGAPSGLLGTS